MNQEKYLVIDQALREGRLSEALTLLVNATQDQEKSIREDAALLQSKFEYNRNQYEIKGIITDQEFNIHYSKTALGAQDILDRLRRGSNSQGAISAEKKSNYRPMLGLLGLLVLVLAAWFWWPDTPENPTAADETADSTIVSSLPKQDPDIGTIAEPILEPETASTSSNTAAKPPPVSTDVAKEAEALPKPAIKETEKPAVPSVEKVDNPPPARTFEVTIMRNSDRSDADIYVDGRPATVLSSTLTITKIRVTEKADMHLFELREAGENLDCKKGLLITQDNQKVTFNCN